MSYFEALPVPSGEEYDIFLRTRQTEKLPFYDNWIYLWAMVENDETHMTFRVQNRFLAEIRDRLVTCGFVEEKRNTPKLEQKILPAKRPEPLLMR